jgi:hypothetical protein
LSRHSFGEGGVSRHSFSEGGKISEEEQRSMAEKGQGVLALPEGKESNYLKRDS